MTNALWTSTVIIEPEAMKVSGMVLFDLARSNSNGKFLGNAMETVVNALLTPHYSDSALVAWFEAHDEHWDGYETWNIPRDVTSINKNAYKKYQKMIQKYIKKHGKSLRFDQSG